MSVHEQPLKMPQRCRMGNTALCGFCGRSDPASTTSTGSFLSLLANVSTHKIAQCKLHTLVPAVLLRSLFKASSLAWPHFAASAAAFAAVFALSPLFASASALVHGGTAGLVRLKVSALSHCNSLSTQLVALVAGKFCRKVRSSDLCCAVKPLPLLLLLLGSGPAECAVGIRPAHFKQQGFAQTNMRQYVIGDGIGAAAARLCSPKTEQVAMQGPCWLTCFLGHVSTRQISHASFGGHRALHGSFGPTFYLPSGHVFSASGTGGDFDPYD